jgi:signal transduction histidine kinase
MVAPTELRTPMHGIVAMSGELQTMVQSNSKASHALAIVTGTHTHALSLRLAHARTHARTRAAVLAQPAHEDSYSCAIDCADHLLSLVNDLLDVERIEAHRLELESVPFSAVHETHKVINMLRPAAGT